MTMIIIKCLKKVLKTLSEDYNYIKSSTKYIKDTELKRLIQTMQKTAWNILNLFAKTSRKNSYS